MVITNIIRLIKKKEICHKSSPIGRIKRAEVLPKWTMPKVVALILHCLRLVAIACKDRLKFYRSLWCFHRVCAKYSLSLFISSHEKMGSSWGSSLWAARSPTIFMPLAGSESPGPLLLVTSGMDSTSCTTGKVPREPCGSRFVWLQGCPFPTYLGSAFWGILETGAATERADNSCVKEGKMHSWEYWHLAAFVNNGFAILPYSKHRK